jgi:hypothetical protein
MAPVLAMMEKGVNMIRERLISLCKEIDPDVDVKALQDSNSVFRVQREEIVTKIAGAMRETAYRRYSAWFKKASKAAKRKASVAQLGSSVMSSRKFIVTRGVAAGKRRKRS